MVAHKLVDSLGRPCVPCPVAPPSSPPLPLTVRACLFGCFWPSQVGVCGFRSVGTSWLGSGECCFPHLPRSGCASDGERLRQSVVDRLDVRRLDGFPLFGGASWPSTRRWFLQCAKTARQEEEPRPGMAQCFEVRRRKARTCPEVDGQEGRPRLVVLAGEVGGR